MIRLVAAMYINWGMWAVQSVTRMVTFDHKAIAELRALHLRHTNLARNNVHGRKNPKTCERT